MTVWPTRRGSARLFVLAAVISVGLPAGAAPGLAGEANPTWGTALEGDRAGRVVAVVESGPVVFVAGEFTGLVPPAARGGAEVLARPYLAALEVATGEPSAFDAAADGPVRALALSPDGRRLYLGGDFDSVGGQPARRLAAVDPATGALDPAFRPPPPSAGVRALAIHDGRLYAGGNFTSVRTPDGAVHDRPRLAAFDADTGDLLDWHPPADDGGRFTGEPGRRDNLGDASVRSLAVSADGRSLYVAGTFLNFGGQSGLLSLDAASGQPTAWQPRLDRPVFDLAVWPADGRTVFAATGGGGGRLFAFDPAAGPDAVWEIRTDGDNVGVVASHRAVYLFGHFDFVLPRNPDSDCRRHCPDGGERRHLAAFEAATGDLDAWSPKANTPTGPFAGAVGADHLWVGGEFTEINRRAQPGIAQFPGVP